MPTVSLSRTLTISGACVMFPSVCSVIWFVEMFELRVCANLTKATLKAQSSGERSVTTVKPFVAVLVLQVCLATGIFSSREPENR